MGELQANENVAAKEADKKALRREQIRRAVARNSRKRKEFKQSTMRLVREIADAKLLPQFSQDSQDFIKRLLRNPAAREGTLFNKVFGAEAKIGDSITLEEFMKKTLLAKSRLDGYLLRWKAQGIEIEVKTQEKILDTVYTITKI